MTQPLGTNDKDNVLPDDAQHYEPYASHSGTPRAIGSVDDGAGLHAGLAETHDGVFAIVAATERALLNALPRRASRRDLARTVGVSIADLHFAFRAVRGVSLYPALLILRLEAADQLLKEGAHRPLDAALQCGFTHYGVFERNYRARFGQEPAVAIAGSEAATAAPELNG